MEKINIHLSIVSHHQGDIIKPLLEDLSRINLPNNVNLLLTVTMNIAEDESFLSAYDRDLNIIRNKNLLGFGSNHNQAFWSAKSDYFMVLNPDLRIDKNFNILFWLDFCNLDNFGCAAPIIISPKNEIEDSARKFPTIISLIKRKIIGNSYHIYDPSPDAQMVDWVAGMFMVFDSYKFKKLNGFDEKYFMYLEDTDICRRLHRANYTVLYIGTEKVVHNARRSSRKKLKYLYWHIRSAVRFFLTR